MSKAKITEQIVCSFCGCTEEEIDFLVEGNNAFICDICIDKAREAYQDLIDQYPNSEYRQIAWETIKQINAE